MDFMELINKRYSVRAYKNTAIDDEKLRVVLEAARLAPSAANRQPVHIIVIRTKGRESELRKIYNRDWFIQAPIIICIVSDPTSAWTRFDGSNYYQVDAAIAMDHLILAATNIGLGTCWIAAFNPDAAREILNLPTHVIPVIFTPLGYPADEPKTKERKKIEDMARFDSW